MARACCVVVLALLMFAIIGLASAEKASPPADVSADDYETDDYTIGAISKGAASAPGGVVAAPLGGPVPPGAFADAKGGDSTPTVASASASAAAYSLGHFSAIAGVASAALAAAFYF